MLRLLEGLYDLIFIHTRAIIGIIQKKIVVSTITSPIFLSKTQVNFYESYFVIVNGYNS